MKDSPSSLDDRVVRATTRWARAVRSCRRGQVSLQRSRWLLVSSRAILDRPRPAFRGGVDAVPDEGLLQNRVRRLLRQGDLPSIDASLLSAEPCRIQRECTVCGSAILPGDIEFRVTLSPAGVVAVHRRCFDLWAREAARFAADGQP